jgi:tRNA G10  N-methylase Trm11
MKYMASFIRKDTYGDFCLPELRSVCDMLNIELKYDTNWSYDIIQDPLIQIEIPDIENHAEKIIERTVLTDKIIQIYAEGKTYDEIIEKLDIEFIKKEFHKEQSYKLLVDARGRIIERTEQVEIIDKILTYIDKFGINGKICMKDAERIFVVVENHKNGMKYFGKLIAGRDGKSY